MNATHPIRNKFNHLRATPGPKRGWQSRAATELGFSRSYLSRLVKGVAKSPAAQAALSEWKRKNKIAE